MSAALQNVTFVANGYHGCAIHRCSEAKLMMKASAP